MNPATHELKLTPISLTASLTSAVRAAETDRKDRLFADELAKVLSEEKGRSLVERYNRAGVREFITIRTRFMDDAIVAKLEQSSTRQVVMLAAGLDTRTFRLTWPPGTAVYELDRPELLANKDLVLAEAGAKLRCRRVPVGVDLLEGWPEALRAAGFQPELPSIWIVEGLLFFLTDEAVRRLLSGAASLASQGSWLITDMVNAQFLASPWTQEFLQRMKADGTPWRFGVDDPERFLAECGWQAQDIKEPGQEGANFGRWPYQVVPRNVVLVPRSFLINAQRSGR